MLLQPCTQQLFHNRGRFLIRKFSNSILLISCQRRGEVVKAASIKSLTLDVDLGASDVKLSERQVLGGLW